MSRPAVLVIDVGTTRIKTALFDLSCRCIDGVSQAHESGELGSAVRRTGRWLRIISECNGTLLPRNPDWRIVGVGVTGFMHSVSALTEDGTRLPLDLGDGDPRTCYQEMLDRFGGAADIYRRTGGRLDVTSVPPQLLAWRDHDPSAFSRIATLLPVKDFVRYCLTGEVATDEIDACGTLLYDVHRRRWDTELLSHCGLALHNLPPVAHCTERAGRVTPRASAEFGVPAGIPVAIGGGDDIEILGTGARAPGHLCEHVGSTGSLLLPLRTALSDPACRLELSPAVTRGEWVLAGPCSNVTRVLDWFLRSSAYSSSGRTDWGRVLSDLQNAMSSLDGERPLFLPYLHGERAPIWDPDVTGTWIGLRSRHTLADLLLSVVEGISFSLRSVLEAYIDLGMKVTVVHSSGGFNELDTRRLRASLYRAPVRLVRDTDPTSFAIAALTLCAIDALGNPLDALSSLQFEEDVEPVPQWQDMLEERFARFSDLTGRVSRAAAVPGRDAGLQETPGRPSSVSM